MTDATAQPAPTRRLLLLAIVLLCLPWLAFSARHALRAGHDCDIWRQWTVSRYVFAGINPSAISLGILEKNYGKMSGENRRRLKDFVIYEVHPSLDTTGVPNFQPAFGSPTATYPPSSLLMICLLGGWLPAGAVHGAWLGLSALALFLLGRQLRGPPDAPVAGGLAVCALLLAWPPIHESIRTLQFIVPVTWFIALMVQHLDRRPNLAALCLAAALIKPSVALPFTLLPLVRGRWTVVGLAGAIHLAATLAMGALVHTPPLDMIRDFLGAIVGHVAHRNTAVRCRVDIDRVESDTVADDGPALFQSREARRGDRGVVPDDERVRPVDLVVEIRVSVAQITSHLGRIADHAPFH